MEWASADMGGGRVIRTGRLTMRPVAYRDLADLTALKADPRAYAMMLGGVRTPRECAEELAADISAWGARGIGLWAVREAPNDAFVGMAGIRERGDGRGMALRFAFWPEARGHGLAREAASAAIRFGHDQIGLPRIIAVAREANTASCMVLSSIGMREEPKESFLREGYRMLVYASGAARAGQHLPCWTAVPAYACSLTALA
jgi:RimJ/RimL family protein N-acetyltransferase